MTSFRTEPVRLESLQPRRGVLWDLVAHDVSFMLYLLDRMPLWVTAVGSAHFGTLENLAYLTMKFDESTIAANHSGPCSGSFWAMGDAVLFSRRKCKSAPVQEYSPRKQRCGNPQEDFRRLSSGAKDAEL